MSVTPDTRVSSFIHQHELMPYCVSGGLHMLGKVSAFIISTPWGMLGGVGEDNKQVGRNVWAKA